MTAMHTHTVRRGLTGVALAALLGAPAFAQSNGPQLDDAMLQLARQTPDTGWATQGGQTTTGGAEAATDAVSIVTSRAELIAALGGDNATNAENETPAIIFVSGTIDLLEDEAGNLMDASDFADPDYDHDAYLKAFDPATYGMDKEPEGPLEEARDRSQKAQAAQIVINVGSNKTIVGLGDDAVIRHGTLNIRRVSNVIVRNIRFEDSYDFFPAWDGTDGSQGNWNSEYDMVVISEADHVWVDHCTLTDGDRPDADEPEIFGRHVQHHDGAIDVVRASDYVTLGWNHIQDHDKTFLIGNSDSRETDRDHLKVTIHHSWFENSTQRSPRVRYGQVHVFNNLFTADEASPYGYDYSFGLGKESAILSEANVFDLGSLAEPSDVLRAYKGTMFQDQGSTFGGEPVDLLAAFNEANPDTQIAPDVGWTPPYDYAAEPAASVADAVRAGAGAGHLEE
ncbi:pectate lyase family protein [Consotaella aegiceratis]|uniref:pectate lyase family protein n=1 Tax=Consotaella aegiceratis TaxID=3097961 RepID=UPI002F409DA8